LNNPRKSNARDVPSGLISQGQFLDEFIGEGENFAAIPKKREWGAPERDSAGQRMHETSTTLPSL